MSEEEIEILKELSEKSYFGDLPFLYYGDLIGKLLANYNKEKEKNKKAIEYINKNCSTNNCDYMEDGVGNLFKDILELLEERN